jgi:hypothetical protein
MIQFKHKLLIASLLWVFSFINNAWSQSPFQVGISMGPTIPQAEFKKTLANSNNSGYAISGFSLNVDADYYLSDFLAVTARFNYANAGINKNALIENLDARMANYLIEDKTRYDIGAWNWNTLGVGFKANIPLVRNRFSAVAGFFPGLSIPYVPGMDMKINDEDNNMEYVSQSIKETHISFAWMTDLSFHFQINSQMQLLLRSSYYQSNIEFNHISYTRKKNLNEIDQLLDDKLFQIPIKTISTTIGFIYYL